jgi:hypothetical protein
MLWNIPERIGGIEHDIIETWGNPSEQKDFE